MSQYQPPFRADTVGSLLRSEELKQARRRFHDGETDYAALRAVEDSEIRRVTQIASARKASTR